MSKTNLRQRITEKNVTKEPTVMETISKALSSESEWTNKDEFLDVIYWMRQIIGVVIGVIWGIIPLKGFLGILLFFAVNTLIIYLYFNSFQRVDEEEYGGMSELLKEGLMTSFSSFMVSWIILYSAIHFD